MKKFFTISLAAFMVLVIAVPVLAAKAPASSTVQWNGESDKAVALKISELQNNTRKNASGPKITSNAHSADFPDLYFIWDSKQKDNGYLKVRATVFEKYDKFTLTTKESNTYWDFPIAPQHGQRKSSDGCYVFYIPKVYNNKNINMVFVSEFIEVEREHERDKRLDRNKKLGHDHNRDHGKKIEDGKKHQDDKKRNNDRNKHDDDGKDDWKKKPGKKYSPAKPSK